MLSHSQSLPLQFIELLHPRLPQFYEYPGRHPFLKSVMGCGAPTQVRGIQGSPLTPRAQDIKDSIGTPAICHPRPPTPEAMAVDIHWQHGLEDRPEFLRNPIAGRDFIHRRPGPSPFLYCCRCQRLEST